jgi:hypothetical protein
MQGVKGGNGVNRLSSVVDVNMQQSRPFRARPPSFLIVFFITTTHCKKGLGLQFHLTHVTVYKIRVKIIVYVALLQAYWAHQVKQQTVI